MEVYTEEGAKQITLQGTVELEAAAVALSASARVRLASRETRTTAHDLSVRLSQLEIDAGADQEVATARLVDTEAQLAVEGARRSLACKSLTRVMPASVLAATEELASVELG